MRLARRTSSLHATCHGARAFLRHFGYEATDKSVQTFRSFLGVCEIVRFVSGFVRAPTDTNDHAARGSDTDAPPIEVRRATLKFQG